MRLGHCRLGLGLLLWETGDPRTSLKVWQDLSGGLGALGAPRLQTGRQRHSSCGERQRRWREVCSPSFHECLLSACCVRALHECKGGQGTQQQEDTDPCPGGETVN